jgi:membrane-associated protease RseP (regulator of RpoE activity)
MTLIAKESSGAPAAASGPQDPESPPPSPPPAPVPQSSSRQILRLLVGLALITAIFLAAGLGDLLLFIVILVVIVMLHELGHFLTAKWSGMKVTEFFVGFGPRLWSVRRGEIEYGVKAIPAGGYVRITGFTVLEDVAAEDEPRTYRQQPFWKRIIVGSAGSAMHFIIAFVLALIVVLSFGVPSNNVSVTALDHWKGVAHTPAQLAGIKAGDTIVSVNGKPLGSFDTFGDVVGRSAGKTLTLGVEQDGVVRQVRVTPESGKGISVDGQKLTSKGYIGVEIEQALQSVNPWRAVSSAADNLGSATSAEVSGVVRTFSPSGFVSVIHQVASSKDADEAADHPTTSVRPVSLVGIANLGVQAQQAGIESLLELLILINVIFGLLNMLPILPFDGGHVAVAVYEWIRTKKGQPYYRADITKMFPVVAVFLALLAVFVISALFLDITHPLKNVFP